MPVAREMLGIKGDECDCGRRQTIRHCIACGSTRLYARKQRYHHMLNGEIKLVDIEFRCQACGHEFIEEERQFCEAPPVGETLARLKVKRLAEAAQRGEYLRPADEKLAKVLDKIMDNTQAPTAPVTIEEFERQIDPEAIKLADSMKSSEPIAIDRIPAGLSREEFGVADRAFRLEWAQKKLMGQDTGIPVEEYVARRMKGELFQ